MQIAGSISCYVDCCKPWVYSSHNLCPAKIKYFSLFQTFSGYNSRKDAKCSLQFWKVLLLPFLALSLRKLARTSTFLCLEVKPGPPNWGLLHCMYGVCVSPPCIFCSVMTAKRASLFQDFMSSGKDNIFPNLWARFLYEIIGKVHGKDS
jgi:hypothetical protein